jgi:hypothetical protein
MKIISKNTTIDKILDSYQKELGTYFDTYRNHVYRVFNFASSYLTSDQEFEIVAIAAAFHDLGIWTNRTFDYLEPSKVLAQNYCKENKISNEKFLEIEKIIDFHHKMTRIKELKLAEIFRQADLVDLSLGMISMGRDKDHIKSLKKEFPNCGFHLYLVKLFFINIIKHPLKPLPMFKI